MQDQGNRHGAGLSGAELAGSLEQRYSGQDWLAALAKAMVLPRSDVETMLAAGSVADVMLDAVEALPQTLEPGDASATDDVFRATTNAASAVMEVDGESGMIVSPSNKGMPSQSGSDHEMRTKSPKTEKNGEFLPFVGVPDGLMPLNAKKDGSS